MINFSIQQTNKNPKKINRNKAAIKIHKPLQVIVDNQQLVSVGSM